MTIALTTIKYAIVVLREIVRIALKYFALNDLEVKLGNILNAYVQSPVREKVWTTLGPELGEEARKTAVIVTALHGLKSAGAAFRSHLAKCMESLGYEPCKADPDLWLELEIRSEDGVQYYSYLLCYVGDILCIHHKTDAVLEWLPRFFPFKLGFGNPDIYLGAKLCKTMLHNGIWAWVISPVKYV